ncbi:hypothetical protein PHAMO_270078 [Magnetospirillum molischianum DSM 120]|uniref:Uncharacterized protein n=1 Tax=Magnetospirillum molischianum DSM 120 TaxID=1150626 RepID=H8FS99_MAGML|nr:hypothetical protein PHAMO_270078 [Magnetospirillum molischianum DSM 120]
MAGRDQSEIDRSRLASAQRHHLTFLQHPQQTGLQRQRHVADFVQEQGAAMRLANPSGRTVPPGAGKCAGRIAEQFGLDHMFGQGAAIDRDDRLAAARPGGMDSGGEHLLADAGFTLQQKRNRLSGHFAGAIDGPRHPLVAGIEFRQGVADRLKRRGTIGTRHRPPPRLDSHEQASSIGPDRRYHPARSAASMVLDGGEAQGQRLFDPYPADIAHIQPKQGQTGPIGPDDLPRLRQRDQPFGQSPQSLGTGMQVQAQRAVVTGLEQLILNHMPGSADQSDGMRVVAAMVSGNVEDAEHISSRPDHRHGGTGKKAILLEEMLAAMNHHRSGFGQGSPDRVGAAMVLVPRRPRPQRHPVGAFQEIGIAQSFDHHPVIVGQDHHTACALSLSVQIIHHRTSTQHQIAPSFEREGEARFRNRVGPCVTGEGLQSGPQTALPGLGDGGIDHPGGWKRAAIKHMPSVMQRGVRLAPEVIHDVSPPWGILPDGGTLSIASSVIAGHASTQEKDRRSIPLFHFATLSRNGTGHRRAETH